MSISVLWLNIVIVVLKSFPVSPNTMKNTALAAVVGMVLCLGVIFLQVMLDNKINSEEDVAKYLELTVVGVIPEYEGGKKK